MCEKPSNPSSQPQVASEAAVREIEQAILMKSFQFVFIAASLFFALCKPPSSLLAQNNGQSWPDSSFLQRMEEIDQRQRILERRWEIEQENAAARAKAAPVLVAGSEGFALKSADNGFLLRLRAHGQIDSRFFAADVLKANPNAFVNRRMRFVFEGTLSKIFDFKFMPDFAGSRIVLQDVFWDARVWPQLKFKVGKFKTPFGLERLQSPTNLLFIERALPNNLVPNRDLGIQLHGDLAGGIFNYMIGVFNGVVDSGSGDGDAYDSKDLAGRIFLSPFLKTGASALQGLGIGIAATTGTQEGTAATPNLPTYNTPGQLTLFRYRSDGTAAGTVIANGEVRRLSPQAYYGWGRFGLLGEYVISSIEVTRAANSAELENRAWQVATSLALTGEAASYKGLTPKKSFDRTKGVLGSFELVARYNVLEVDSEAFPVFANPQNSAQKASAWAVGLNWYLNRNAKIVLNYEQTSFEGGAMTGDRPDEKAFLSRFQIAY